MAYINTIFPGYIPEGYFDDENILFIADKVRRSLKGKFKQDIVIDRASIVRILHRVLNERLESIPKMNQRTIMYIMNDFRSNQYQLNRQMKWEFHFKESQRLYDPSTDRGPNLVGIKLANRLGKPLVGGTTRFYFT